MGGLIDLEPLVVDLIARDAIRVPPYPAVAMRLQKTVGSDKFGIPELVKVAGEDQVLAATLLRCANSALYRGLDQVTTLQGAIGRIGAAEVCRVAMAITIGAQATENGALAVIRRKSWRQGLISAIVAKQLAAKRGLNAEEAFVCGLLHDFGRVVAVACFEEILTRTKDARALPEATWSESVDRFHVELGVVISARWNLSDMLRTVISTHHTPDLAGKHRPMVDLILASDAIVELMEAGPRVSTMQFSDMSLLRPGEMEVMLPFLPQIPSFIAALDDASPVTEPPTGRSQVLRPASVLTGTPKQVSFPVAVVRAGGTVPFTATHVTSSGLGFTGGTKLKENNVVRLKMEAPSGAIEVWVTVALCASEAGIQRVEAKLFASDRGTQEAWDKMYASIS